MFGSSSCFSCVSDPTAVICVPFLRSPLLINGSVELVVVTIILALEHSCFEESTD